MSAMRGAPDIKSSNTTRISDDKLNKLAHTVADTLAEIDEVVRAWASQRMRVQASE